MCPEEVLAGIKVVDFGWVGVGPVIARELAFHGATVIRVESHRRLDILRLTSPFKDFKPGINTSAFWAAYNANKYGMSLDLNKPGGQEVAEKLVSWADIIVEGMMPGTMARWRLDYENCRKIRPDIIYCSTTQFGQYGPLSKAVGYGMHGAGYAGFSNILGWPDGVPLYIYNNICDFIAPYYAVATIMTALIRRHDTGQGMYLEQSQVESGINALGVATLDYRLNNRVADRQGNRDRCAAPHGVYPCRGDDRWLAIAITTEQEWLVFCRLIGEPWTQEAKFSTALLRKRNEDELDALVAAWTLTYPAAHAMQILQDAGIPAGVVKTGEDLLHDPQLKFRKHFRFLEHKVIGKHAYHSPAYQLSRTPSRVWKAAPCLGEDNLYIYKELLGFSEDEISDLLAEGVITTETDAGVEITAFR